MQRQSVTDPRPGLTKRQTEVLERLERGTSVKGIAKDIGVTPAAVYQTIERLRRSGHLPEDFTPSGERPRRTPTPGPGTFQRPVTASRLAEMRDWESHEGHAALIEAAIVAGDVPALAYCLGRADAGDENGLPRGILEAALRRLGVLGEADAHAGTGGAPTRKRGAA
jgi:hypothetical protein